MQTRQYNRATRTQQRVKQQQHYKELEATKTQLLSIYGEVRGLRTQYIYAAQGTIISSLTWFAQESFVVILIL
jgi:hypothetical protein